VIAAIYARKSTDDSDRNAEARSTVRQIESARKYAETKGWTVDSRYVFADENTSGAEWKHRPGFRNEVRVSAPNARRFPNARPPTIHRLTRPADANPSPTWPIERRPIPG
jgi:hypothetical protein